MKNTLQRYGFSRTKPAIDGAKNLLYINSFLRVGDLMKEILKDKRLLDPYST